MRIVSASGELIDQGDRDLVLRRYLARHRGCKIWWGDHFRVMKRRRDPETLMHKCKQKYCKWSGEQLHTN